MDFSTFFRIFFNYGDVRRDSLEITEENRSHNYFNDQFENNDPANEMLSQIDNLLTSMFSSFGIRSSSINEEMVYNQQNPRQMMLKNEEDENICNSKECENSSSSLETISLGDQLKIPPSASFSNYYSSYKSVQLPDGTIEEHQTIIDNNSTKTTKISRTIGKATHEIITKSDKNGLIEKEDLKNITASDLQGFENKWKKLKFNIDSETLHHSSSCNTSNFSLLHHLKKLFNEMD